MSAAALFPAYNEYRDTRGEIVDAVGRTRLLKLLISLLKNSRRLFWTHICFFWFHTLFSCAGILSLLIPPPDTSYSEMRSVVITLLLIGVKPFSLTMQVLLYLMTLEQRHSRKELNHSEPNS
jgi:hypothetical protein